MSTNDIVLIISVVMNAVSVIILAIQKFVISIAQTKQEANKENLLMKTAIEILLKSKNIEPELKEQVQIILSRIKDNSKEKAD